ncbi:MFS transporter [Paenibacillus sp. y28]|uniref:MFS transporter n=1 Tax=Paenibacillus sp. y28 TaxID=3129110 RepID=UPI00301AD420
MNKRIAVIMVLLMTLFLGFGIIIPVMPIAIPNAENNPLHLGLLLSVYSLFSFIFSPLWGGLSDRIGRRPVIMTGLIGFALSFFLFGIAGDNLVLMYLSRILGGLASGAATACAVAYVADITTEENRTKGMGLVGMSIGMGFIFGPAIGGLLSGFGTAVPFFAAGVLSLLTLLFAGIYLQESLTPEQRRGTGEPRVSRWSAFSGKLKYLYVLSFFVSFTLAGLESTLQVFAMRRFDITPQGIGYLFLISGIVGALIQGGVVRRVKPGTENRYVLFGLLASAVGFFLLMLADSMLTTAIYLSVFSVGNALIRPCVTSLITQKTTVRQGVASGLSSSMDSLGRITGPLLGTLLFNVQDSLPYLIGGVLCIAAIILLQRFIVLDRKAVTLKTAVS